MTRKKRQEMLGFFRRHYPHIQLPTIWRLLEKLEKLTGVVPEWYECCPHSCVAFTEEYSSLDKCPWKDCGQLRYHPRTSNGKLRPRKRWLYLPIVPRLRQLYASSCAEELSTYRAGFVRRREDQETTLTDIFDAKMYQDLLKKGFFAR